MHIYIHNSQKDLPLSKSSCRELVTGVLKHLKQNHTEVSIYFVTNRKMIQLHEEFFQDPAPTDCISFPIDDSHLGEIFVCPATAMTYAASRGIDPYDECALYIIHGILHCLGYDDLEPKKKRTMRKMEKRCMDHVKTLKISLRP